MFVAVVVVVDIFLGTDVALRFFFSIASRRSDHEVPENRRIAVPEKLI